jgi:hypothetical protein
MAWIRGYRDLAGGSICSETQIDASGSCTSMSTAIDIASRGRENFRSPSGSSLQCGFTCPNLYRGVSIAYGYEGLTWGDTDRGGSEGWVDNRIPRLVSFEAMARIARPCPSHFRQLSNRVGSDVDLYTKTTSYYPGRGARSREV